MLILCVFVLQTLCVYCELILPEIEEYHGDILEDVDLFNRYWQNRPVDSTARRTVNKFYCSMNFSVPGSHLLVYGSKGWNFPLQDVNLTLGFPTVENKTSSEADQKSYLVTGFRVILYIDGEGSRGYIIDGGVLQDSISLSFVSSGLTSLRYQFWLYGVRKDNIGGIDFSSSYHFCR